MFTGKLVRTLLVFVAAITVGAGVYAVTLNKGYQMKVAGATTAKTDQIEFKVDVQPVFEKSISYGEGMSALEATKLATNGKIEMSGEGENAYVNSILGLEANKSEREFWELMVNGQSALVGAGSLILKPGDNIEWKLSKF